MNPSREETLFALALEKPIENALALALFFIAHLACAQSFVPTTIARDPAALSDLITLSWPTIPGKTYDVQTRDRSNGPGSPRASAREGWAKCFARGTRDLNRDVSVKVLANSR